MPTNNVTVSIDSNVSFDNETHPPLRLTPDKSEIVELNQDVRRVIIGNETHLNIFMDTTKRMIVVPRVPGATQITLLGNDGQILMQRHVIIANPKKEYIRIRQSCAQATGECMPIRMYYCPDMCHEIAIRGEGGQTFSGSMSVEEAGPQRRTTSNRRSSGNNNDNNNDGGEGEY